MEFFEDTNGHIKEKVTKNKKTHQGVQGDHGKSETNFLKEFVKNITHRQPLKQIQNMQTLFRSGRENSPITYITR